MSTLLEWVTIVGLPVAIIAAIFTIRGPMQNKKEVKPPEWKGRLPTKQVSVTSKSTFRVTANYTPAQRKAIVTGLVILVIIMLFIIR